MLQAKAVVPNGCPQLTTTHNVDMEHSRANDTQSFVQLPRRTACVPRVRTSGVHDVRAGVCKALLQCPRRSSGRVATFRQTMQRKRMAFRRC
jgi:hypothetical protein